MKKIMFAVIAVFALMLSGCATVPVQQDAALVEQAKSFSPAPQDQAFVYVYRDDWKAKLAAMKVYLDDKPVGATVNKTFLLMKVKPGKHVLSVDSEFSKNNLDLIAEGGKTYYVEHYMRIGVLFNQSDLEVTTEADKIADAQASIRASEMLINQS